MPVDEAQPTTNAEPSPVLDGRSASELFAAGMAAAEAGETERALGLLEGAVTRAPDNLRHGAEYRQAVIEAGTYDRALALFEQLAEEHPGSPNLLLNYGYAHVDKIPAAGAITQVILANTALTLFTRSLEAGESWLARYTRGNSYVYWPPIFGRLPAGIADLEQAVAQAEEREKRSYQALAYAALGDGYWRSGEAEKARGIWARGLERFPGDQRLLRRAEASDPEIETLFEEHYNPNTRVDTTLRELWRAGWQEACDCDPEAGP